MIRNLLALLGLTAIALVSAATLQAQGYLDDYYDDGGDPPMREAVSTRDLDLTSREGVRTLEKRINAAISRVCPDEGFAGLRRYNSIRQCREDAVASVRPQVDRAVAAAEERGRYYADRGDRRWRRQGRPAPDRYAARAPNPPHDRYDDRRYDDRRDDRQVYRRDDAPRPPLPPLPPLARKDAKAPPPPPPAAKSFTPPPGARLVRRTVTTTTTTTTTRRGEAPPPETREIRKVIIREAKAPVAAPKAQPAPRSTASSAGFARRSTAPHSWLPPVAWGAVERATARALRRGKLERWGLTDQFGIARSGYVSVSAARWIKGRTCRNVQVVKYHGRQQIVVASGMRCNTVAKAPRRAR